MICFNEGSCRRKGGFTLVELVVALMVFAIVLTGGFACVKMGLTLVDNSRHNTRVAQIMQSEIERVRSMPWAMLTALDSETEAEIDSGFNSNTAYASYTLKRIISGSGDSRQITLVVTWSSIGGKSYSKSYAMLYTKGGLYDYIQ